MTTLSPSVRRRPDTTRSPIAVVERLVLIVIALIPLAVGWVLWASPDGGADFNRRVTLAPFDIALGAFVLWWMRVRWANRPEPGEPRVDPLRRVSSWGHWRMVGAAALVLYCISLAAHPSPRGWEYTLRLAAAAMLIDVVRRLDRAGVRRLGIAFAISAVVQAMLAIAQSLNGTAFALYPLDHAGPLFAFGDTHAGRGGLSHPYHLAVFLLVSIFAALVASRTASAAASTNGPTSRSTSPWEPWLWRGAAAVAGAGLAVTFSRTMLLALVPASAIWWLASRSDRRFLGALLAGLAVTAAVFSSGWVTRAEQSTGSGVDRGRNQLAHDALDMAADHPLLGVGPARYVIAATERDIPTERWLPAHNVVAHGMAEFGYAGGTLVGLIGVLAAARYLRRGLTVVGGALVVAPFFVLDAYPYVFPTGIALTAIWIGLLENPHVGKSPR